MLVRSIYKSAISALPTLYEPGSGFLAVPRVEPKHGESCLSPLCCSDVKQIASKAKNIFVCWIVFIPCTFSCLLLLFYCLLLVLLPVCSLLSTRVAYGYEISYMNNAYMLILNNICLVLPSVHGVKARLQQHLKLPNFASKAIQLKIICNFQLRFVKRICTADQ